MKDLATSSKTSPLVSHHTQFHADSQPNFRMTILKTFKLTLDRQLEEASRIVQASYNPLNMNSRAEWRSTPLPQVGFSQGRVAPGSMPTFN